MPTVAKAPSLQPDYKLLSVEDLSAGLDLRKAATLLKPNRSRVLRNWSLRELGALTMYPGWVSYSTSSLGSGRPQGAQRIYLGNAIPFTLAAWQGSIYQPSDAGLWGAAVSTGWDPSAAILFPYDRNLVAVFDGLTAAKKSTDGLIWTTFGIAPPAAAPTSAALAGGSLVASSSYEFSYTGRDDELLHESNESATVTHVPAGGNLSVTLTLPFHPNTQVDTLVVYGRDTTAGEAVRRRIGTVANPGSGTATYAVTSNSWGSGVEAPTDHTVPELMTVGVIWKNRWWGIDAAVGNRLRFTQIFEPQSWPATFYIDIPFEKGDDIAAIIPLGDTLVVWGQSKPFLIIGQTSLDFEVRPSGSAQAGALGPRAVDVLESGIIHAAAEGIYLFDGATDRLLSYDVDGFAPTAIGWRTYITSASATELAQTPVVYDQAAKEIAIGVTHLYPFGTPGEWILDLNRTRVPTVVGGYLQQGIPAWTTTDRSIGGYLKWDGHERTTGNRGRLFSWSQTIGTLYEERTGTTADGADLVGTYTGATFAMGGSVARIIDGSVEFEPHGGTFGIELQVDSIGLGSQTIDISGTSARYDLSLYDVATYDAQNRIRKPLAFPLEAEGLTAEITATYTGQEAFKWFVYRLRLLPETDQRSF